jgi:hypothetical protein
MAKITERRTAKAKPPATRISIDEALQRLLSAYQPHVAAEHLNTALRENGVRLWCDGNLLSPNYIGTQLVVQASNDIDGRWRGVIVPAGGAWEDIPYRWEMDAAEVANPAASALRFGPTNALGVPPARRCW